MLPVLELDRLGIAQISSGDLSDATKEIHKQPAVALTLKSFNTTWPNQLIILRENSTSLDVARVARFVIHRFAVTKYRVEHLLEG